MARRIYLAGPEVFLPDAAALGAAKKALCARHGFEGLYPADGVDPAAAESIYRHCLAEMRRADLIIANLTPFRGPGADPGTVFELGYMVAAGKPCFAYTNDAADLLARIRVADPQTRFDAARKLWVDGNDMLIEDYGLFENVMLVYGLSAPVVVRAVPVEARFTDLDGLRACLELARAT
jgi:nucleoside 2-deoxyribosyltransferase